jgi:anti-sigma regulatory factor (Ser/Thr protein kinase)
MSITTNRQPGQAPVPSTAGPEQGYRHEAWLYEGLPELVERACAFVRAAVEAGEPVYVVLPATHLAAVQAALDDRTAAADVEWGDMSEIGRNPARIIAAWRDFLDRHAGSRVRGIGEPAFSGRSSDELVECLHHEALLNLAVDPDEPLWLACPYDVTALPPAAVEGAHVTHPLVADRTRTIASDVYRGTAIVPEVLTAPLRDPGTSFAELRYNGSTIHQVRDFTETCARAWGVVGDRVEEIVLAVNELAANSARHATGSGRLRSWAEPGVAVFEVCDDGHITDPMVGRRCPEPTRTSGRGVWMVHHLCDLVQLRSDEHGTTVRARINL